MAQLATVGGRVRLGRVGSVLEAASLGGPLGSARRFYDADTVIVGSGFGGSICAWILWSKSREESGREKILVLERGGWWLSPEKPAAGIRDFLEKRAADEIRSTRVPESRWHPHYWPRPDHTLGMLNQFAHFRRTLLNREGLWDIRRFRDLWTIAGNGVGGGSLVYANVTVSPDNEVLDSWPGFYGGPNSSNLKTEFDQARAFIGVNKIVTKQAGLGTWNTQSGSYQPANRDFLLDRTRVFEDACAAVQSSSPSLKLNFEYADLSITELPGNALTPPPGPGPTPNYCERQGRCVLGCLPGARHTLNKLLFKAMVSSPAGDSTLEVRALCEVSGIRPCGAQDGREGYEVDYRDGSTGKVKRVRARRVILAAGTLGTTEILLGAKEAGDLPDTSGKLGFQFSINGDSFGFVQPTRETTNAARGPVTTSHAKAYERNGWEWDQPLGATRLNFACTIEDSGVPRMWAPTISGGLSWIRSLSSVRKLLRRGLFRVLRVRRRLRFYGSLHKRLHRATTDPQAFQTEDEAVANTFFFACMGLDRSRGTMRLSRGLLGRRLVVDWPDVAGDPIFQEIERVMHDIAQGMIVPGATDTFFPDPLGDFTGKRRAGRSLPVSVHPIGGCPMGRTAAEGVVDPFGRVFRGSSGTEVYENLYIADGSILPTAIGVNPSLTISALAFKIAKTLAGVGDATVYAWLQRKETQGA